MSVSTKKISPCLWFDHRIEEAVNFYVTLFAGRILDTSYYNEAGPLPQGTVMTMTFTLHDEQFMALNGGPHFKFNEAVSFMVMCKDQAEVDHYWNALTADGGEESQCGWLKDKFGVSWQVVPEAAMEAYVYGPDPEGAQRGMQAMLGMRKLVIAELEAAYRGE